MPVYPFLNTNPQICLARNGSNSEKCSREILELYRCCERLYVALDGKSKEDVKGGEACPTLVSRLVGA